MNVLF